MTLTRMNNMPEPILRSRVVRGVIKNGKYSVFLTIWKSTFGIGFSLQWHAVIEETGYLLVTYITAWQYKQGHWAYHYNKVPTISDRSTIGMAMVCTVLWLYLKKRCCWHLDLTHLAPVVVVHSSDPWLMVTHQPHSPSSQVLSWLKLHITQSTAG